MLSFFDWFWGWVGGLETPQATFITAVVTACIAIVTIAKTRKTAREKNALEFEIFCQTNQEFMSHWAVVRGIIMPLFIDGEVNEKKQRKALRPYVNLAKFNNEKNKASLTSQPVSNSTALSVSVKSLDDIDKKNTSLLYVLNTWERCANAIRHNIYDEKYIYSAQGTTVILIYNALRPYMESKKKQNPRAFLNIQWLATKWAIKHTIHGKTPNKTRKTIESINVARERIKCHVNIKRCYFKLYLSQFMLMKNKKPKF